MATLLVSGLPPPMPVDLQFLAGAHQREQQAVARFRLGGQVGGEEIGAPGRASPA